MTDASRTPTPIDQIADAWVDTSAELSPLTATYIGRFEHNGRIDDFSPAGHERAADEARKTLAALEAAEPVDFIDEVTKEDLSRELRLDLDLHEAKAALRDVNVIASPAPTNVRASNASGYVVASANPAWDTDITHAPAIRTRREPYRSTIRPTGICIPA